MKKFLIVAALLVPTYAQANIYEDIVDKDCHDYYDVAALSTPNLTRGRISLRCSCITDMMLNWLKADDFPISEKINFNAIDIQRGDAEPKERLPRAVWNSVRYCVMLKGY